MLNVWITNNYNARSIQSELKCDVCCFRATASNWPLYYLFWQRRKRNLTLSNVCSVLMFHQSCRVNLMSSFVPKMSNCVIVTSNSLCTLDGTTTQNEKFWLSNRHSYLYITLFSILWFTRWFFEQKKTVCWFIVLWVFGLSCSVKKKDICF